MNMKIPALSILSFLALSVSSSFGVITYGTYGFSVTQDFNTLTTTGWTNDTTLTGWSLFNKTPAAITSITLGTGSSSTGNFYSFATAAAPTDKALGGVASGGAYFGSPAAGTVAGWIAVALTNTTGITLDTVAIRYDGEQFRNGGNTTAQTMVLEYGVGASFAAVSTWTAAGAAYNFTSPVASATAAAVDGNAAGLVANIGGTLTGVAWNNGDTLWIRWVENNDTGNDHGLALDNFSFAAVPEPSAGLLGLTAVALIPLRRRRK